MLPICSRVWDAIHGNMDSWPWASRMKKANSPSPSDKQLLKQLLTQGWGLVSSWQLDPVESCKGSTTATVGQWMDSPVMSRNIIFSDCSPYNLWSLSFNSFVRHELFVIKWSFSFYMAFSGDSWSQCYLFHLLFFFLLSFCGLLINELSKILP